VNAVMPVVDRTITWFYRWSQRSRI